MKITPDGESFVVDKEWMCATAIDAAKGRMFALDLDKGLHTTEALQIVIEELCGHKLADAMLLDFIETEVEVPSE